MKLNINDKVKIKSFLGLQKADKEIDDSENYWHLIGKSSKVIKIRSSSHPAFPSKENQVLIQFDEDLSELDLVSHNKDINSLWFFVNDIEHQ